MVRAQAQATTAGLTFIGPGEGEALDAGCGAGRLSGVLKACGDRVTAIDPVEVFITAAGPAGSADDERATALA